MPKFAIFVFKEKVDESCVIKKKINVFHQQKDFSPPTLETFSIKKEILKYKNIYYFNERLWLQIFNLIYSSKSMTTDSKYS